MSRIELDIDSLFGYMNHGWFVAWFSVEVIDEYSENPCLYVDLACNYRLQDGKVLFVFVRDFTPEQVVILKILALNMWAEEFSNLLRDSLEEISK